MSRHHSVTSSPFAEYAQAIGSVCMSWTFLEVMVDQLLLTLIPTESEEIGYSITSNIEFSDKIQMARALGHVRKLDDQWFEELKIALDRADNELRIKRNRYVHDLWIFEQKTVKKLQFMSKLKRPQASKPLELTTLETTSVLPSEIWAASDAIHEAAGKLALLTQQYQMLTRRASRQK